MSKKKTPTAARVPSAGAPSYALLFAFRQLFAVEAVNAREIIKSHQPVVTAALTAMIDPPQEHSEPDWCGFETLQEGTHESYNERLQALFDKVKLAADRATADEIDTLAHGISERALMIGMLAGWELRGRMGGAL